MARTAVRDKVFTALTGGSNGIERSRFRLTDQPDPVMGRQLRLFSTAGRDSYEESQLFRDVEERLQAAGFKLATHWMPVASSTRMVRHIVFTGAPGVGGN